ncbi:hypothetical protein N9L19_00970 [bacterium]|nr:hypothetical protein [bacterium]
MWPRQSRAKRGSADLGTDGRSHASAAPPSKQPQAVAPKAKGRQQSKPESSHESLTHLIPALTKLSLNTALVTRELAAATFTTIILAASFSPLAAAQEEARSVTKERQATTKARRAAQLDGEDEDIAGAGEPTAMPEVPLHLHVYVAFIKGLAVVLGEGVDGPMTAHIAALEKLPIQEAHRRVSHFKVNKTFSSKTKRLTLAIADSAIHDLVVSTLVAQGAKRKIGRAPPGAQNASSHAHWRTSERRPREQRLAPPLSACRY